MRIKFQTISEELESEGAPSYQNLTPGNVYRVISLEVDSVRVMDDQGEPVLFPLSWFSVVDDKWPSDWEVTVGADGERYIGPEILWENYFWERYFDGDRAAIQTLKRRLREWEKYES